MKHRGSQGKGLSEALKYVIQHRQKNHDGWPAIVNLSLGVSGREESLTQSAAAAILNCYKEIDDLTSKGILFVTAAGNSPPRNFTQGLREESLKYWNSIQAQHEKIHDLGIEKLDDQIKELQIPGKDQSLTVKKQLDEAVEQKKRRGAEKVTLEKEIRELQGSGIGERMHNLDVVVPAVHPNVLSVGGYDQTLNCCVFAHGTGKSSF